MRQVRRDSTSPFLVRRLVRAALRCCVCACTLAQLGATARAAEGPPSEVSAAAKPTVELDYDTASTSPLLLHAVTRLRAELHAAGFASSVAEPSPVSGSGSSADESTYGRVSLAVTGEQLQLEVVSASSASSSHATLRGTEREVEGLMLQATEFLRAGLVPRAMARTVRREPPPVPRQAPPPPQRRRWVVDAGISLATNWGAGDLLPLASFAALHYPARRLAVGVAFDVPLDEASYDAELGSADYRIGFGTVEADYAVLHGSRGSLALGIGVGAARTLSSGQPLPPLQPDQASLSSLALGASLRAELRLWRYFALTARARVVSLSPNPLIAVVDDERRLGNPCLLFSLGARVTDDHDNPQR